MKNPTPLALRSRSEVSGAAEIPKLGQPKSLAEYVATLAKVNAKGVFTEIRFDGTECSRTYGELFQDAVRISAHIGRLDPQAREVAILCFSSVIDYVAAAWACLLSGITFAPLATSRFNNSPGQLSDRIQSIAATLARPLVLTEEQFQKPLANALSRYPASNIISVADVLAEPLVAAKPVEATGGLSDILIETSGTTGLPKFARLAGDLIMNRLFDGITADDRICLNLLVHHSVGGLRLLLPIGRRNIYLNLSRMMANPETWLDCVSKYRVTDVGMGSGIAAKINEYLDGTDSRWDLTSLKRLAFGSEAIVPTVIRRLVRHLQDFGMRDAEATLVYSMTETGPLFSSRLPAAALMDPHLECEGRFKLNRCADSWTVRVVGESGEIARNGEVGRIQVRSATRMFRGYYPSGDGLSIDGWFETGDVGALDDEGLLLTGRDKSMIAFNSRKISGEQIEARLREVDGIKTNLVIVMPFRDEASSTDALAVFYVPRSGCDLDALSRRIAGAVAQHFGIAVSHLVPIKESDLSWTPTGKVRRHDLVALYRSKKLTAYSSHRNTRSEAELNSRQRAVAQLWKSVLGLNDVPSLADDFFELGGDSLASAELVSAIEENFSCDFPVEAFFEKPTLINLDRLLAECITAAPSEKRAQPTFDVMRELKIRSAGWRGHRLFPNSLLVGFNIKAPGTPIIWVTQEYEEAAKLARHLSPRHPFYALRSCVNIVPTEQYSDEVIETVCNRYLWEILELSIDRDFVLGGTCQGGILALQLARKLNQIRRSPLRFLALLEWSFSQGKYEEPVLLLYGQESYTAAIYQRPEDSSIKWQQDFPRNAVASIPGPHASLVKWESSVGRLAEILIEHESDSGRVAERRDSQWWKEFKKAGANYFVLKTGSSDRARFGQEPALDPNLRTTHPHSGHKA